MRHCILMRCLLSLPVPGTFSILPAALNIVVGTVGGSARISEGGLGEAYDLPPPASVVGGTGGLVDGRLVLVVCWCASE